MKTGDSNMEHGDSVEEYRNKWHQMLSSDELSLVCLDPQVDSAAFSICCSFPGWNILYQDNDGVILERIGESM
jgi:hypothetical protein